VCVRVAVLDGSRLECRANLVITPDHLTKQWQDELAASCPSLHVVVITSRAQHDQVCVYILSSLRLVYV